MKPALDDPSAPPLSPTEVRSIIWGVLLAMFLAALDQTIVATAMPSIGRDLGSMEYLPWVVTAYLVAATAVTPLYGKSSDIYGRRATLLVSISVFLVGSVLCAVAPTMPMLVLARALQGLGGGGLLSLGQTIIADIITPRERARYQIYIAGVFVVASVTGPILGGLIAQYVHWSAIFWVNLPFGLAAFWLTYSLLRKLPRHERPHRLDVLGAGLMVGATITFMVGLNWGGVYYEWHAPQVVLILAASAVLWVLFGLRLALAPEPLIPSAVLSNNVVATGTFAAFFCMGTFIGLTIFVPIYLEMHYGLTASHSGLALLPLMAGTVAGATISARVMVRVDRYKRLPMVGLALATCSLAFLAMASQPVPLGLFLVLFGVASLGLGSLLPVTTIAIQNAVEPHQMGTATATMNFFRQLGGALIVALFGIIILGDVPAEKIRGLTPETFSVLARSGELSDAYQGLFGAATFFLALAFLFFTFMQERPLRGGPVRPSSGDVA